ncbi:MAG: hypothetical protein EOS04_17465 [Mesorhizobium sp.]|nr:MAG: hypothetical protein EOR98_29030 [Mesorhizobium sp.]RWN78354.1 MAG: hypothetical protein EOS01_16145 [Mesorhizobium sp.]RWN80958.1 MAG: hypothetical protein EOS02_03515 [Mesorhizobium sp.]RWN86693.1 MAG: hypothetical protein EOS04_17465 [Mesorhizobium sp.]RWO16328.1 MAG: hypothetical protein EOS15_04860 [Mesorhizobium sp.]
MSSLLAVFFIDPIVLQRRASFWTRTGRCSTLIWRMIPSENRFRFSGSCATTVFADRVRA